MWTNSQFFADLLTSTKETPNRKIHILGSIGDCLLHPEQVLMKTQATN